MNNEKESENKNYKENTNINSNIKSQATNNQSLIEMCSKKLEKEPNHKKALLLRAEVLLLKQTNWIM